MLEQVQVPTTTLSPVDLAECEKTIADLAECGITAQRDGDAIALIGAYVELHLPAFDLLTSETYAAGYGCGQQQCRQSIQADLSVSLSDQDFTRRIDQAIPATLSPEDHHRWRAGFLTGWVMQWYQEWSN
ncbi:MAG TPA: hypothetical protein VKY19_22290 [Ktedonosporobacter sp.]|jgi:hypothetical protein|nr:hypothetical protein [Ktedonosporobacter sp.]